MLACSLYNLCLYAKLLYTICIKLLNECLFQTKNSEIQSKWKRFVHRNSNNESNSPIIWCNFLFCGTQPLWIEDKIRQKCVIYIQFRIDIILATTSDYTTVSSNCFVFMLGVPFSFDPIWLHFKMQYNTTIIRIYVFESKFQTVQ